LKSRNLILISILGGTLCAAAWPAIGNFAPLILLAFIPFLAIEDHLLTYKEKYKARKIFTYLYPGFVTWNALTTYWIFFVSEEMTTKIFSVAFAVLANSLLMTFTFYLFHLTRRIVGRKEGYVALIIYWLSFEYFHLDWDCSWPWLNLGHAFSNYPSLIQWYEYTGAFGGSLWILVANIIAYRILKQVIGFKIPVRKKIPSISFWLLLVMVPIIISLNRYYGFEEKSNPTEVVVIQPNIDPYRVKFTMPPEQQLEHMLNLAATKITDKTAFVVFPETALQEHASLYSERGQIFLEGLWENNLENSFSVQMIREFLADYHPLDMVIGMSSRKLYETDTRPTISARHLKGLDAYYDSFNSALHINQTEDLDVYYKSKLVVGVELMPFISVLGFLDDLAINLGGTTGTLGIQEERSVFTSPFNGIKTAPVICYESIYGEYVGGYVNNGAQFISIITNDGWWDDTPGYHQHKYFASLRAIEHRRSIARSANTGTSCFVNQRGDISHETPWWEEEVISHTINLNDSITFYTKHGDYIPRTASFVSALLLLLTLAKKLNTTAKRLEGK
jgi:apolipoprotein N-acyltransferase